jgi:hypothetical protein
VKFEDTVVVTDEGHEILTATGEWPAEEISVASGNVARPSILEKGAA